jgi:hypothetical protein
VICQERKLDFFKKKSDIELDNKCFTLYNSPPLNIIIIMSEKEGHSCEKYNPVYSAPEPNEGDDPKVAKLDLINNAAVTVMEIAHGCPGNCASCGAFSSTIDGVQVQHAYTHLTREEIERNLTQELGFTGKHVYDLLAERITTGVNSDPLASDSFSYLAEAVDRLTEGRSKVICITHGLRAHKDRFLDEWKVNPVEARRLEEIDQMIVNGIVPNLILTIDVAHSMGYAGAQHLKIKKEGVEGHIKILEKKLGKLESLMALLGDSEQEEKELKLRECLEDLLGKELELNEKLRKEKDQEIETLEALIENIYEEIGDLQDEEIDDVKEKEDKIEALREKIVIFSEKKNGVEERKQELISTKEVLEKEEGYIKTGGIEEIKRCRNVDRSRKDELEKVLSRFSKKIKEAIIETNARSYFETLKVLLPTLLKSKTSNDEKDKKVVLSLQGDFESDSLVSTGKAISVLSRLKELMKDEYGQEGMSSLIDRMRITVPRFYISAGRAAEILGITESERGATVIPDKFLATQASIAKGNRGRVYMNGDLAVQTLRQNRSYNDLVVDDGENPWLKILINREEIRSAIGDVSELESEAIEEETDLEESNGDNNDRYKRMLEGEGDSLE